MAHEELFTSLLYPHVFDADVTRVMGVAYEAAKSMLHDRGQPALVREVIARKIVDLAGMGERDPEALARRALEELGLQVSADTKLGGEEAIGE